MYRMSTLRCAAIGTKSTHSAVPAPQFFYNLANRRALVLKRFTVLVACGRFVLWGVRSERRESESSAAPRRAVVVVVVPMMCRRPSTSSSSSSSSSSSWPLRHCDGQRERTTAKRRRRLIQRNDGGEGRRSHSQSLTVTHSHSQSLTAAVIVIVVRHLTSSKYLRIEAISRCPHSAFGIFL